VAGVDERADQSPADEAGAAGDQYGSWQVAHERCPGRGGCGTDVELIVLLKMNTFLNGLFRFTLPA
jgi:hypothetical protein